jgi:hypothetical protein
MNCLALVEKAVFVRPYVGEFDRGAFLANVSVIPSDLGITWASSYRSSISPVSVL